MLVCTIEGALCATSLIIVGAIGLVGSPGLRQLTDSLFYIIFGALFLAAEIRIGMFLYYFSFLKTPMGLGLSYIFVGMRAFGWPWWGYIIMILAFGPGAFYLILACTCAKLYEGEQENHAAGKYETKTDNIAGQADSKEPLLDPVASSFAKAALSNPGVRNAVKDAVVSQAKAQIAGSLPPHWVERMDEGSGTTYYVNTLSGATSWERPC